jgi:hypothetical protein
LFKVAPLQLGLISQLSSKQCSAKHVIYDNLVNLLAFVRSVVRGRDKQKDDVPLSVSQGRRGLFDMQ